ncbi:putative leucine-rich repeat receptor-like protein kinase [Capsicum baccatum]|uniref:Leucine-rich repeat receptor-like protein kinase n=1 Tax=Capsicum baccatum TaxID=33114 RepID=A0A2G2VPB1_CAPBA|nr:putative leucine-rich repeat receptor-like protein kinase [Capsicum baccatum]
MGSNFLNGSIPISLGNLKNLSVLYLYKNQLSGFIPKEIGYLRVQNLSHNRLQGHIPLELGNLSVVESLDLSSNHISGAMPQNEPFLKAGTYTPPQFPPASVCSSASRCVEGLNLTAAACWHCSLVATSHEMYLERSARGMDEEVQVSILVMASYLTLSQEQHQVFMKNRKKKERSMIEP